MEIIASSLDWLLAFLLLYKYWGLFFIAFISSFMLPIPASAILAAAGAFASQGYLDIYSVLGITVLGSIAGDLAGFFVARRYGEQVLYKIGFRRILNSSRYRRVEGYIKDFAPSLIFFSRFLTEISPAINLLSGLAGISYRSFFIFALLGETAYTAVYGFAGYILGNQWENNISFLAEGGLVLLSLGLTINLIQAALYKKKQKKL